MSRVLVLLHRKHGLRSWWCVYRPKLSDVPNKDVRREYFAISGPSAMRLIGMMVL